MMNILKNIRQKTSEEEEEGGGEHLYIRGTRYNNYDYF